MKNFQIYLAGGMSKFNKDKFDEGNNWRVVLKNVFENNEKMHVTVINPNDYFNFKDNPPQYRSQREVMEFDLNKVRNSDLIIINYNDMYSLGTMAELAIAYEHRIPVIGFDEQKQELYPWQVEMTNRIFDDIQELIDYVKCFYLCE